MEKIKMYVSMEDLNEEEKRANRISYKRLIERISNNIFLFNKACDLSNYDFEFVLNSDYDEENEDYKEIYQYYLININEYMLEILQQIDCKDLIIAYSETLENYILLVDHFGTSWDYVLTNIEPTNNINESNI